MARSASLTGGMATSTDEMMPISAYASAQKGSASGSVAASAAVPSPCALPAVARPRVMGSLYPNLFNRVCAKFAPRRPVSTTAAAVMDVFCASSRVAIGIARATVTERGTIARASSGASPTALAMKAVEKREKAAEMVVHPKISAACRTISLRCVKIRNPKERMTDPRKPMRRSPPPGMYPAAPLLRNILRAPKYDMPETAATRAAVALPTAAHTMMGCRTARTSLGIADPAKSPPTVPASIAGRASSAVLIANPIPGATAVARSEAAPTPAHPT
mmetsp:Transcript_69756/g.220872  ORF Transcript_69756/g.220872 Transcript_69756/m.220872 type:complete len:275 (-) Transcript_69756:957-1781(-)